MLMRISLIVAILAAIAVGVLNFVTVKEKMTTLLASRDSERQQKVEAQTELASTKQDLEKTTAELTQTKNTLQTTTEAKDRAEQALAVKTKEASDLKQNLETTIGERDNARAELGAYVNTGYTPQQIITFGKQIKDAQDALEVANEEKRLLSRELVKTENELRKLSDAKYRVPLPADLKGKVLAADPKWDFVVLDFGEDQNVLKDGELLVSRDGRLVAKLVIRSIEKDRCIANVIPGSKISEVMEGDQVIAAYPAS